MDTDRAAVWLTVGIILSMTLISGPLVKGVTFTQNSTEAEEFAPGTGSMDVTVLSLPATATFEKGQFGAGAYYLRVPDAVVNITHVEQQPMLVYKLRIPEIGFSRETTHFLDRGTTDVRNISLKEATISPDKIQRDSYSGELLMLVRAASGERVLTTKNVTVSVKD